MRLRHPDGTTIHLAYCTNVHPATDLAGVLRQLDAFAEPVRRELDVDVLGLGLWLAAPVAVALCDDEHQRYRLRRELIARGLEVVTLNGFPYGAFHAPVVKRDVYVPDWTDPARLDHTTRLARILAELLPDDAVRGSISTVPLGWREPWGAEQAVAARRHLNAMARGLAELSDQTGRRVRVALEPEPGCVVETTPQAIAALSDVDEEWLGVCLDLAHLACAWEQPADSVTRFQEAGIAVVKAQVSAALEVTDPASALAVLRGYAEPRFLHQTRTAGGEAYDDLDEALATAGTDAWRVHFHVPLHAAPEPPLSATVPVLRSGLAALLGGPVAHCDHLEVETYTWSVLPPGSRPTDDAGLIRGIAAEMAFARAELIDLGLRAVSSSVEVA